MTVWLWTLQQLLASALQKTSRNRDASLSKDCILSVGRWWKKLHQIKDKKRSLESFTDSIQRESELSVIEKCEVSLERVRPHPTRNGPFVAARYVGSSPPKKKNAHALDLLSVFFFASLVLRIQRASARPWRTGILHGKLYSPENKKQRQSARCFLVICSQFFFFL